MVMCPARINGEVGGEFALFNGGVTGSIVSLTPDSKIVEEWRFSQWDENVFSTLELCFEPVGSSKTRLVVKQSGIPAKDRHGNGDQDRLVLGGWNEKFFVGLEKVLLYV